MIDGIDVSYVQVQAGINFQKLATEDMGGGYPCRFMYVQSSKYSNVADGTFWRTVQAGKAAGLRCGAYHFCSQNHDAAVRTDPVQQMEFFFKSSQGLGQNPGELPPILDWEFSKVLDRKWNVQWLVRAAVTVKQLWYPHSVSWRRPVVYTYPWFALEHKEYLIDSGIEEVADLCFASYKSGPVTAGNKWGLVPWYPVAGEVPLHKIPSPWERKHLKLVQYSGDRGLPVPGIPGYTDRQLFLGSMGEFDEFCGIIRPPHQTVKETKDEVVLR